MATRKQKAEEKSSEDILNEYKERNKFLAKDLAKWKVNYAFAIKERDHLHAESLSLRQQRDDYCNRLNAVLKFSRALHQGFVQNSEVLTGLLIVANGSSYQTQQAEGESYTPKKSNNTTAEKTMVSNNPVVNNESRSMIENMSGENSENASSSESGNDESEGSEKVTNGNKSNRQEQKSLNKFLSTLIEESEDLNEIVDEESQQLASTLFREVRVMLSPCKVLEERLSQGKNQQKNSDVNDINKKRPSNVNTIDTERLANVRSSNNKTNSNLSNSKSDVREERLTNEGFPNIKNVVTRRGNHNAPRISSPLKSPIIALSSSPRSEFTVKSGPPSLSSTIANFTDTFERDTEQALTFAPKSPLYTSNRSLLSPGFSRKCKDKMATSTPYHLNNTSTNTTAGKSLITSPLMNKTKRKKLNLENMPPALPVSPTSCRSSLRHPRSARPNSLKEVSLRKKLRRT